MIRLAAQKMQWRVVGKAINAHITCSCCKVCPLARPSLTVVWHCSMWLKAAISTLAQIRIGGALGHHMPGGHSAFMLADKAAAVA